MSSIQPYDIMVFFFFRKVHDSLFTPMPLIAYLGVSVAYDQASRDTERKLGRGGIRTHVSEETGAENQRLRPLGHATKCVNV